MMHDVFVQPEDKINLAGTWVIKMDPSDKGLTEAWYERRLDEQCAAAQDAGGVLGEIRLPGSLQSQGYGDDISIDTKWTGGIIDRSWFDDPAYEPYRQPGQVKIPFWLQPDKHYVGVAWYQRAVEIPEKWVGKRVTLTLGRPHWQTQVWCDDQAIGTCDSLSTPHTYDLGVNVASGRHIITVRVDNRLIVDVGQNAHSVADHTQTNWNGIVGEISLTAGDPVWLSDIQVYPNVDTKSVWLVIKVGNSTGSACQGRLRLQAESFNTALTHHAPVQERMIDVGVEPTSFEVEYSLGNEAQLWDEFNPALYHLAVSLEIAGTQYSNARQITFGLREISVEDTQFTINGRKTFLRGTLDCAAFPLTGYPPTDVASWQRIMRVIKSHGLNHVRFHSWCPPEAAFVVADELGVYLQVECSTWAWIGLGKPVDRWLYAEGERIVTHYGNHPSFVLMAYGNEPWGEHKAYLKEWVTYWKAKDQRRLYTSGAGWPMLPENQYHNIPQPRIQHWKEGLNSRINALPPETQTDYRNDVNNSSVPIVSHEIGQWCAYPNFAEISKYTGVLKAKNFEIFRDTLNANHMGDQAQDFLMASGKLQALCYKEDIESALRTPGFGGFQLLGLNDFPGQGTALVGVLDAFWDEKGYITPQEFRRFCGSTVLLARMDKRLFTNTEQFQAHIEIAHFGPAPIEQGTVVWRVSDAQGKTIAMGKLPPSFVPIGNGQQLGVVSVNLEKLTQAQKLRLEVNLEGYQVENDWDFWVFPSKVDVAVPAGLLVTDTLNTAALSYLDAGGKVLYMPNPATVNTSSQIGFSSIFWNTSWTRGQEPHTLGVLCDPAHPALDQFPTEYHSNWQWWELVHGSAAMCLDELPTGLRPIIQVIDDWFHNRRLGLLFAAKVRQGKLLVCSMDLSTDLENRLAARQMLHSILRYADSDAFQPTIELDVADLTKLIKSV